MGFGRVAWREALSLALRVRRLWPAALLLAVGLSECWRILFGWDPQWAGEKAADWVQGGGWKGFPDVAVLLTGGLAVFLLLRAVGYLGETVLIVQVSGKELAVGGRGPGRPAEGVGSDDVSRAGAPEGSGNAAPGFSPAKGYAGVPSFAEACANNWKRFPILALTLLPWDAARVAAMSLPSLMVILWGKWDPRLRFVLAYLLAFLLWFLLLLAVYVPAGISAALAAREVVIGGNGFHEAWRRGWGLFRVRAKDCLLVWLQTAAADALFLIPAWLISGFLSWAAGEADRALGSAPSDWLVRGSIYALLAVGLLLGASLLQAFKSSLWTLTFLRLKGGECGHSGWAFRQAVEEEQAEMVYPPLVAPPDENHPFPEASPPRRHSREVRER